MSNNADQRFYFGSNFKMHKTLAEVRTFVQRLKESYGEQPDLQLFIFPPFTSLGGLQDIARPQNLWIGAQNMHWASSGAYTGEISAPMLCDLGVDLVLLGHAERRHKFCETDSAISRKVQSAVAHNLRVLLCIGETAKQRRAGITDEVLAMQLKIALQHFPAAATDRLIVAYEPVWAIGAGGQEAQPGDIAPSIRHVRRTLKSHFGDDARRIPILYGGSVTEDNCGSYVQETEVDGLFVGRAAWEPSGFMNVLTAATRFRHNAE
ncbi:MAG: triose-phosphate isomerase [Anaerolineae bacterium]|nr:triose-phosphate isomerase [Anaerolineae bacterium]